MSNESMPIDFKYEISYGKLIINYFNIKPRSSIERYWMDLHQVYPFDYLWSKRRGESYAWESGMIVLAADTIPRKKL